MVGQQDLHLIHSLLASETQRVEQVALYAPQVNNQDWSPITDPDINERFDVSSVSEMNTYGLLAVPTGTDSGGSDGTSALEAIASNTSITNWYFPSGSTFRLSRVTVPDHVTHVFSDAGVLGVGDSAVIVGIHYTYDSGDYDKSQGIAFLPQGETVFSGLKFHVDTALAYDGLLHGAYIYFFRLNDTTRTEVRNCRFEGLGRRDLINVGTGYGVTDATASSSIPDEDKVLIPTLRHRNLKIYDCYFNQSGHFCIEIQDAVKIRTESQSGLDGLEIFNNVMSGVGTTSYYQGISLVRLRLGSTVKVYNNLIDTCDWGIELATCHNVMVYNNDILGASAQPFIMNGQKDHAVYGPGTLVTGSNKIYLNIIIAGIGVDYDYPYIYMYYGNKDEIYDNFLNTRIHSRYPADNPMSSSGTGPYYGPNIHDNIIIDGEDSWVVKINSSEGSYTTDFIGFIFRNNSVYGTSNTSQNAVSLTSDAVTPTLDGNTIRLKNGVECFTNGYVQTNGICVLDYVGAVPTSKVGAGIQ